MKPVSAAREHQLMSIISSSKAGARWVPGSGAPLLVLALAAALSACAGQKPGDVTGSVPDDYRVAHPIAISEGIETMDIPVGIDMARLPESFRQTVAGFGQRFIASGSGIMAIVSPVDSPNEVAAASVSHQIRDVLIAAGVGAREIEFRGYKAGPNESGAPVRLAYNSVAARTEPCGPWTDDVSMNAKNRNYGNFGCATQQNLAAMVENPLDLLYPRGVMPSDAGRRTVVLEKYRNGTSYKSADPLTGGSIAQGVGN
jgi:pilus assembly protein CpaD